MRARTTKPGVGDTVYETDSSTDTVGIVMFILELGRGSRDFGRVYIHKYHAAKAEYPTAYRWRDASDIHTSDAMLRTNALNPNKGSLATSSS